MCLEIVFQCFLLHMNTAHANMLVIYLFSFKYILYFCVKGNLQIKNFIALCRICVYDDKASCILNWKRSTVPHVMNREHVVPTVRDKVCKGSSCSRLPQKIHSFFLSHFNLSTGSVSQTWQIHLCQSEGAINDSCVIVRFLNGCVHIMIVCVWLLQTEIFPQLLDKLSFTGLQQTDHLHLLLSFTWDFEFKMNFWLHSPSSAGPDRHLMFCSCDFVL